MQKFGGTTPWQMLLKDSGQRDNTKRVLKTYSSHCHGSGIAMV